MDPQAFTCKCGKAESKSKRALKKNPFFSVRNEIPQSKRLRTKLRSIMNCLKNRRHPFNTVHIFVSKNVG